MWERITLHDGRTITHSLRTSITVPSVVNSYSMAIKYMSDWFFSKFDPKFFKNIHIDGKHVLDDYRNYDITKKIKVMKPNVSVIPQFDPDYDRDKLDSYPYGIENYIRRSRYEDSFFKDYDNNLFLATQLEIMKINFTFRVRVATKAQQIDVFKFMQLACRVGSSQGKDITMDYHIPYSIIRQIAVDAGFKLDKNNEIINTPKFLSYLNTHTRQLPVIIKYRPVNNRFEYFLRFREQYVRIFIPTQLSMDEGERVGMVQDNFIIEMNAELDFPSPKMYMYYSNTRHDNIELNEAEGIGIIGIKMPTIPDKNSMDWDLTLTTDYESDTTENVDINIEELFNTNDSILYNMIRDVESSKISPSTFIDLKIFNDGYQKKYTINWETMILHLDKIANAKVTIAIYIDSEFVNQQIINNKKLNSSGI